MSTVLGGFSSLGCLLDRGHLIAFGSLMVKHNDRLIDSSFLSFFVSSCENHL